tara:strand:- start:27 stop:329 length:303 start_codon:yes stop_codon:yes gene_type:complete
MKYEHMEFSMTAVDNQSKRILKWFRSSCSHKSSKRKTNPTLKLVKASKVLSYLKRYYSGKHYIFDEYIGVLELDIAKNGDSFVEEEEMNQWFKYLKWEEV